MVAQSYLRRLEFQERGETSVTSGQLMESRWTSHRNVTSFPIHTDASGSVPQTRVSSLGIPGGHGL